MEGLKQLRCTNEGSGFLEKEWRLALTREMNESDEPVNCREEQRQTQIESGRSGSFEDELLHDFSLCYNNPGLTCDLRLCGKID